MRIRYSYFILKIISSMLQIAPLHLPNYKSFIFMGKRGLCPPFHNHPHARGKLSDRSHTYVFMKRPLERTDLRVRRMKTHIGDRAFSVAGPRCWNSLPSAIRVVYSVDSFKAQVKT